MQRTTRTLRASVCLCIITALSGCPKQKRSTPPTEPLSRNLRGRVTHDGKGLKGAVVLLTELSLDGGAFGRPGQSNMPLTAVTGADGRWRAAAVPAGKYVITAAARTFRPAVVKEVVVPARGAVDFELSALPGGAELSGTIKDRAGNPLAGAVIIATPSRAFRACYWGFAAIADKGGRYALTLEPGEHMLYAVDNRFERAQRRLKLVHGQRYVEPWRLQRGAVLRGRVVGGDGKPVPGALVTWRSERYLTVWDDPAVFGNGLDSVVSDKEGRFVLRRLPAGLLYLRAVARGKATLQPTLVEAGGGEAIEGVQVTVRKAYRISGKITLPSGAGVGGVFVGARDHQRYLIIGNTRASEPDGSFELDGVPPGRYRVDTFSQILTGDADEQRIVVVEKRDVGGVRIVVPIAPNQKPTGPAAGVRVSVRTKPPVEAAVSLKVSLDNRFIRSIYRRLPADLLAPQRTTQKGRITLSRIPPGKYHLLARTVNGRVGHATIEVKKKSEKKTLGVVIKLKRAASLAGQVLAEGDPLPDVTVRLRRDPSESERPRTGVDDAPAEARTSDDGSFKLTGLAPGRYLLTVSDRVGQLPWPGQGDKRWLPLIVELAQPKHRRLPRLVVHRPAEILGGIVKRPGGAPVGGALVTAWRDSHESTDEAAPPPARQNRVVFGSEPLVVTDAKGRFELKGLRRGAYRVSVDSPEDGSSITKQGATTGSDVELTLSPPGQIKVVVTCGEETVGDFFIEARAGPSGARRWFAAAAKGGVAVTRLQPGTYRVRLSNGQGRCDGEATVKAGETTKLQLAIRKWGAVKGRLVDALSGKPIGRVETTVAPIRGTVFGGSMFGARTSGTAVTDSEGRFHVERLIDGSRYLWVRGPGAGEMLVHRDFELKPGQTLDLGLVKGRRPELAELSVSLGLSTAAATWADYAARAPGARRSPAIKAGQKYLWVDAVYAKGIAERAGLKVGDRITRLNGYSVQEVDAEVVSGVVHHGYGKPGGQYTFEIERGARKTIRLKVPSK